MTLRLPTNNRTILAILRTARVLTHEGKAVTFERDTDWTEQAQAWEEANPVVTEPVRTSRVYTEIPKITTRNPETTEAVARR